MNINTLMMVPKNWNIYFNRMSGMNLNLGETTLVSRFIFYIFLFISIGGLFTSLFYKVKNKKEESGIGYHLGAVISGYFCIFTAPAFFLFLASLPNEIIRPLLKENLFWGLLRSFFLPDFS